MAPRMVFYSAKKCHELGVKTIVSQATGDKHSARTSIGYRYWPKLGFDAELTPKDYQQLAPRFHAIKTILELYKMEGGEAQWRKIGSGRKMYFDTTPGSLSQLALAAYLKDKEIKP